MSTHNIGFYEEISEVFPELSSNIIKYGLYLFFWVWFQDIVVEGYKLPADYAVVFMTYGAQRDPEVFKNPDDFIPQRWLNRYRH